MNQQMISPIKLFLSGKKKNNYYNLGNSSFFKNKKYRLKKNYSTFNKKEIMIRDNSHNYQLWSKTM